VSTFAAGGAVTVSLPAFLIPVALTAMAWAAIILNWPLEPRGGLFDFTPLVKLAGIAFGTMLIWLVWFAWLAWSK
jgi:hypothetical protein